MMTSINIWAILLSAVASMIIGSIWYGPLFGKLYMKESGMTKLSKKEQEAMKKKMGFTYALQFLASILMFYVLALLIGVLPLTSIVTALIVWMGFIVPIKLGDALWGGKMTLFWLGTGNMLLTLIAGALIISAL